MTKIIIIIVAIKLIKDAINKEKYKTYLKEQEIKALQEQNELIKQKQKEV